MLRFTIRDVLRLTVVVALAVGLWAEHRRASHLHAAHEKQLAALSLDLKHRDLLLDMCVKDWREMLEQLAWGPSIAVTDDATE